MYADANQQQFPPTIADAAPYFKEGLEPIEMNFEIVYVGSITNITNAAGTVVLREKHASQTLEGKWRKTYGFADGHAEIRTEPDGNFDDWESQHIIPPPAGQ
jgi:prepilin-type processing-associated H-X9-DG protein